VSHGTEANGTTGKRAALPLGRHPGQGGVPPIAGLLRA
jgi:hypothetical protein